MQTHCLKCKKEIEREKKKEIRKKKKKTKDDKTYCFSCRNYTSNANTRKVNMTNKVIIEKPKCFNGIDKKSNFLKQN